MSKAQELSIGMFVVNKDKDLPIKGKINSFTDDGKAVVKNYLNDQQYTLLRQEFEVINCMYSVKVFTIGNGEQEFGEYPTEFQLWEELNEAIRLSKEYPMNTPLCIVMYVRQEYVPAVIDAEYIMERDIGNAWIEHEEDNYLMDVDDTHSDILEERLNKVYIDWLREFGYMPNCGDILEMKIYHVRDNLTVYSHTINNIKHLQETT